ncbi:MAG: ABC transporter permease [Acidobacteriota bacterium]|nr:ABC transporter permease [Acidobacteriota bacterium]
MHTGDLLRRIRFLLRRRADRRELQEEMSLHRELRARQLTQQGGAAAESSFMASRLFGNQTLLGEKANDMWGWNWLEDFAKDLRHTARTLGANRAFATFAILTLALGIGTNTAIFSVTNALLLRTLPVQDPGQIYHVSCDGEPDGASNTGDSRTSFSNYVFQHLRTNHNSVSDLMAYVPLGNNKIAVRAKTLPEEAAVDMVSGNFFTGLRVRPACGRMLSAQDESSHTPFGIVSYAYASSHFGSACAAVGRPLFIKGLPFTIVGVTASNFVGVGPAPTDIWVPFQQDPEMNAWGASGTNYAADSNWWCLLMIARLKPGVTRTAAEASLNPAFQHAAYEPLGGKPHSGEKPTRLHLKEARGLAQNAGFQKPLLILQVMVGLLLVIACGNVSMLLAVRNAVRRREFSVRLAIGGSPGRLFRQLFAESVALVFSGALLGLLFAFLATRVLARWAEIEISLAPDRTVLLFTLAVSVAAAFIFGIAPAFRAARIPIANAMKISSATSYRDRSRFASGTITAAIQLALCLTLLVGTGLLVRTLQNLENVNVGFPTGGLLVFGISPHLPRQGNDQAIAFYRSLTTKLRSIPQVQSVTLEGNRLASGWSNNTDAIIDGTWPRDVSDKALRWNNVGPDFFQTLGIHLIEGRDFNEADSQTAPLVAVVNRTFLERFLHGRNPLGHTVSFTAKKQFTIVGVAEDSKYTGIQEDAMPMAWFPYTQAIDVGTMQIELRTAGNPAAVLSRVRKVVADFGPDLALLQPKTQQAEFDGTISDQILMARLSISFAVLAVVLVAIGLYGTISYNVTRRTSELGLRMALGAERGQVLWMVLRSGLLLCVFGIGLGLPLATASSHVLGSLLYGVAATDPLSLAAAVVGILSIGLLATYLPARRAATIDPMIALRNE